MKATILIITTLSSGLMAGLFYSWSISVTPGLAKIGNTNYLQAFQSMNRAILNPAFFIFFMGLIILLPLASYLNYTESSTQFWFILSATIIYFLGVMAVTIFGNVPMNNTLEVLQIESMRPEQMASFRLGFESKWNNLNMIRTICSSFSFVLLVLACFQNVNK